MSVVKPAQHRFEPTAVGRASRSKRWVLLTAALAAMLLFAAVGVLFSSATLIYEIALTDHVGRLCLLALSALLSPLHHVFEFLIAAGIVVAVIDRVRAAKETRLLMNAVIADRPEQGSALWRAAEDAGLAPERVRRLTRSPLPAFTLGAFRPRVFVDESLERILSHNELVAVLAHEREHVVRRDPLRLSGMRFLARALFWLPASRALEAQVTEETELRADAAAALRSGVATAAALLTLVHHFGRVGAPSLATGLSQHEFIALRVRLLTGENSQSQTKVSRSSIVTTVGILCVLWLAALAELHQATHSKHLITGPVVCGEHDSHPVRHLFCVSEAAVGETQVDHAVANE